jgi:hypothetical protein
MVTTFSRAEKTKVTSREDSEDARVEIGKR